MRLFKWLHERGRSKILATPFPDAWRGYLEQNLGHYACLTEIERQQLRELVQVFVAEKDWEGCGGLELTDEIRVTIAGEACLLILALPHDLYRAVRTILVYPSTVIAPEQPLGAFEIARAPIQGAMPILGQAHLHGPIILTWDSVLASVRHPERGHDVVMHEFAHKLDMLDGSADGTPPLVGPDHYERWTEVCDREFQVLRERSEKGKQTFLDEYGSVNEAEFFAVVTEHFFGQPLTMRTLHAELYELLCDFYRQDSASRADACKRQEAQDQAEAQTRRKERGKSKKHGG